MPDKTIKANEIKAEDIDKEIQKTYYGKNNSRLKAISKLFTFIALFSIYLIITLYLENYGFRIIYIVIGLAFLTVVFQASVVPSFKKD